MAIISLLDFFLSYNYINEILTAMHFKSNKKSDKSYSFDYFNTVLSKNKFTTFAFESHFNPMVTFEMTKTKSLGAPMKSLLSKALHRILLPIILEFYISNQKKTSR